MSNMQMNLLFPTPVGEFSIARPFTEQEIKFVKDQIVVPNNSNKISQNKAVLDSDAFSNIKAFIGTCVAEYFTTVYKPMYDVRLRITQSWLNYTDTAESHHSHAHQNSFVSGVFYIQTDATDKLYFATNIYRQLEVVPSEHTIYNSNSWWLPAVSGKLLLFPSQLVHHVAPVVADSTRISLSFNTFPVGQLGHPESATGAFL